MIPGSRLGAAVFPDSRGVLSGLRSHRARVFTAEGAGFAEVAPEPFAVRRTPSPRRRPIEKRVPNRGNSREAGFPQAQNELRDALLVAERCWRVDRRDASVENSDITIQRVQIG